MKLIGMVLVASIAVVGCKKDEAAKGGEAKPADKGGDKAGDKGKADTKPTPPPPAAATWLAVDKLGVTLEVPGDAKAEPGAGDSFMIMSDSQADCVIMLGKEDKDMADSYEKTLGYIKDGKMGHGKLKAVSKEEQGADGGWKIEWTAESSIDPTKTLYGVDHRVMIDGAIYGCARKTDSTEGQACVAKACASLKKK